MRTLKAICLAALVSCAQAETPDYLAPDARLMGLSAGEVGVLVEALREAGHGCARGAFAGPDPGWPGWLKVICEDTVIGSTMRHHFGLKKEGGQWRIELWAKEHYDD